MTEIVGAELQAAAPAAMAARWGEVLGLSAEPAGEAWRIALHGGELRFVAAEDGRGEGLGAFDVAARDIEAVTAAAAARGLVDAEGRVLISGTRVRLLGR